MNVKKVIFFIKFSLICNLGFSQLSYFDFYKTKPFSFSPFPNLLKTDIRELTAIDSAINDTISVYTFNQNGFVIGDNLNKTQVSYSENEIKTFNNNNVMISNYRLEVGKNINSRATYDAKGNLIDSTIYQNQDDTTSIKSFQGWSIKFFTKEDTILYFSNPLIGEVKKEWVEVSKGGLLLRFEQKDSTNFYLRQKKLFDVNSNLIQENKYFDYYGNELISLKYIYDFNSKGHFNKCEVYSNENKIKVFNISYLYF